MQLQIILRQVPDRCGMHGQVYRLWSILGLIVVLLLWGGAAGRRHFFSDAI